MWKYAEYSVKPEEVDATSSKDYVYVRKDIKAQEREEGGEIWTCYEQIIPKKDWEIYSGIVKNDIEITEMQDALIELANIVVGG